MNIYEIDNAILSLVDQETGELLDYDAFSALQMERDSKIEQMALWAKNLLSGASAIKAEEEKLVDRRKAMESKAKRLKEYLSSVLDGEKFETARCKITYRSSSALDVLDPAAATGWLENNGHSDLVVYSPPTLDKRSVSTIVKSGVSVPGVEVSERKSLQLK